MPSDVITRQCEDEDTQIGLVGFVTKQAGEGPEQHPEDCKRGQTGPERSPNHPDAHAQRKEKKRIAKSPQ
jgi:hypothetical protein